MFVTNWISTTKIQKISEITNFFRHYFLSRTEVNIALLRRSVEGEVINRKHFPFWSLKMETFSVPSLG